jgi:hypothetical protein
LVIEYPKRWHKHAAAADDVKSKLMKFEHHLISTEYINIANEMK